MYFEKDFLFDNTFVETSEIASKPVFNSGKKIDTN